MTNSWLLVGNFFKYGTTFSCQVGSSFSSSGSLWTKGRLAEGMDCLGMNDMSNMVTLVEKCREIVPTWSIWARISTCCIPWRWIVLDPLGTYRPRSTDKISQTNSWGKCQKTWRKTCLLQSGSQISGSWFVLGVLGIRCHTFGRLRIYHFTLEFWMEHA